MKRILLIALFLCGILPLHAHAASISRTLLELRSGKDIIVFQTTAPIHHQKVFLLQNPDRLVVDIDKSDGQGVMMPKTSPARLIRNIRFGQFDEDTSRIVIDLAAPAKSATLHQFTAAHGQPHRIEVEVTPRGALPVASSPLASSKPSPKPSKPLIVIDAGHGGKDPGATGASKGQEKHITLAYALALKKALQATGRYRVLLTRETDIFILLNERVKIAQRAKGAIFISIHADSAPSATNARGLSIYTVSETASDEEAAALAKQENESDVIDGLDLGAKVDKDVADILIELAQRETKNKSSELADKMVSNFTAQGIHLLPSPHRYAGFRVLKAPEIPSVLIETGFISTPTEEVLVKSEAYRQKVIRAVIAGLDGYFKK